MSLEPTRDHSSVLDSLGQTGKSTLPLKSLHFNEELKKIHEVDKDMQVERMSRIRRSNGTSGNVG